MIRLVLGTIFIAFLAGLAIGTIQATAEAVYRLVTP